MRALWSESSGLIWVVFWHRDQVSWSGGRQNPERWIPTGGLGSCVEQEWASQVVGWWKVCEEPPVAVTYFTKKMT